ncbi:MULTISPECIES: ribbon-helix-helix protein, CopG family [Lactobacillaceae]|jgi:metal-responsive CopG/Arc/MetJ family transcriptional regulator|uniref:CopG family transcriptional regulator n=1 Tax=Ligilactobacillus salivarius TaxID=1624 RepID=A0A9X6S784_9LACO|nr:MULTISPECIES: ribbon-helix-helix protein, CopG family [Lactobacillaceae]MCQ0055561.1 CopG family transcriptional regulator [Pediococcus acidilactici]OTF88366.1 CopG family transcriptional regulator [Ligilactobacillus salivarius]PAY39789.1 CopG family transcriptional regulator [Ligilactobacillus salivarius]PAY44028.1 CopG family transcriptional regulator [Ligilactobacillus salivarius]PAY45856.1 CopG family transcriptional regulator [Ligilactobacillus salivarius]
MSTTKKRLTITLSETVYNRLSEMSKVKGLSKSALLTVALDDLLKKNDK